VLEWPKVQIQPPQSESALDEAIENCYGYDWIIFVNSEVVRFFLQSLSQKARDVSDLDALRVCAIEEATAHALEEAHVHIDVRTTQTEAAAIVEELAIYAGGVGSLDRVNFLLPQAAIGRNFLVEDIENAGARVDLVITYQTVANEDLTRLVGLQTMLATNSIDAVVFSTAADVSEFARLFDTNNLRRMLRNVLVFTTDDETTKAAKAAGLLQPFQSADSSANSIVELFEKHIRA